MVFSKREQSLCIVITRCRRYILLHNDLDVGNSRHINMQVFWSKDSGTFKRADSRRSSCPRNPMNNEWRSRGTATLRRMRVWISCQAHCTSPRPSVLLPLLSFSHSFSLSPVFMLLLMGVRTRKCVRHSRETHILITNSRSRGLLPRLVVTPNPIFRPEWRVGEPKSSIIRASERANERFAPDPV